MVAPFKLHGASGLEGGGAGSQVEGSGLTFNYQNRVFCRLPIISI